MRLIAMVGATIRTSDRIFMTDPAVCSTYRLADERGRRSPPFYHCCNGERIAGISPRLLLIAAHRGLWYYEDSYPTFTIPKWSTTGGAAVNSERDRI
jgi:hypothetical protein